MLVSDCFKQYLKSLYLTEYPCHSKPSRLKTAAGENEHPMYEIERLLDLIRDKKSPWHEAADWTRNGDSIREAFIKDSNRIDLNFVEKYFTSLRFNDLQIVAIDKNVTNFVNLNELTLTCNQIEDCDSTSLPASLNILDLTGNYLNSLKNFKKKPLINLQHFGLAYNWIYDIQGCFEYSNWPSLTSLDLSCNQFNDLVSLTHSLLGLKKLKVLMLYGNPVVLLPGYRGFIINNFDDNNINLFALDDKVINREERLRCQDFKLYADSISKEAIIKIEIKHIKNFPNKEQPEIDETAPEAVITRFLIRFLMIDDQKESHNDFTQHRLHSMKTEELEPLDMISLNEKGSINIKIKSLREMRDFMLDGTEIELVERRKFFRTKEVKPSESVMSFTKGKDAKVAKPDAKDASKKKADAKNSKAKKKTLAEALESFVLFKTDEKSLAHFDLELSTLLDGQCKEVKKEFSCKINLDDGPKGLADKSLASIKEDKSKNAKAAGGKKSATKQMDVHDVDAENKLCEIDLEFKITDFVDLKELKEYSLRV